MRIIRYFARNILAILGVVLVWRGCWYVLDEIEKVFFEGSSWLTALGGIALGLLVLFLPDKDLKELERL